MVRESTRLDTWNEMRVGMLGLDQPGDHIHRRPLGGQDQVQAGRARAF